MAPTAHQFPTGITASGCLTPLGDADATVAALLAGRSALQLRPVLGRDGGDPVPLALIGDSIDETYPPRWLAPLRRLVAIIPAPAAKGSAADAGWGTARAPVIVTSSNFGVGSMHAFTRDHDARHLQHGPPFATVELLRREFGWGENVTVFSHACVTAHLGLAHAGRLLHADLADEALVLSFDFVSAFVAGGFHSLKILNGTLPAPFSAREIGAIGLGDGAAFAVLTRDAAAAPFRLEAHALHNEMHHFTSNQPDGAGFAACASAIAPHVANRRVWVKGHGTGTLDAGRLEAETIARIFPGAPLVSWKGALGHTLGSCGLVELALVIAALRTPAQLIPGSVGAVAPTFAGNVALTPFGARDFDAAILASNAFGGAHAAMVLSGAGVTEQNARQRLPLARSEASAPASRAEPRRPLERFIHHVRVELPVAAETAVEARERLREKFPRSALRRMTHLGLLLGATLEGVALSAEDAVVYATSYAETRALEDFLSSFPAASPLLFQTSIHPGGVQQVLIGRQQPVARLWPLAGRARLVEQALAAAVLEPARRTLVLGGEERGTWLLEHGMASVRAFAFALALTPEPAGAVGRVTFSPGENNGADGAATPTLEMFASALAERQPLEWRGENGAWTLTWQ